MTAFTLTNLFGANATQDINSIYVHKADLELSNVSANNSAQTLIACIVWQVWQQFTGTLTDQNNNNLTDENGNKITYDNTDYWDYPLFQYGALLINLTNINNAVLINEYTAYTPE